MSPLNRLLKTPVVDMRIRRSSAILLAGPSQAGKTHFVANLIRGGDNIFEIPPTHYCYYYQEWNSGLFDELQKNHNIEFFNHVPSIQDIRDAVQKNSRTYFIIDDWAQDITGDIASLFKVQTHHLIECGLCLMTQNLFSQNKHFRDITLNATYLVLFKTPRDKKQLMTFASQFMPQNPSFIMQSFLRATETPYNPLIVDLHQRTLDSLRVFDRYLDRNHFIRVFQPLR